MYAKVQHDVIYGTVLRDENSPRRRVVMDSERGETRPFPGIAIHAVAERTPRTGIGELRGPVAVVRHRSGIVLALDLGLFRRSDVGTFRESAGTTGHAGRGVVRGGAAQLHRPYSYARASRCDGHHEPARGRASATDAVDD